MSIVILIAPTLDTATAAWDTLCQSDLTDAAPSRRDKLTPQQMHELMLKTLQQRLGTAQTTAGTVDHAPTHTLDKIWTELATDLVLANVDVPRFGWHQALDTHTPGFWQRFDPHTRFVLVYENPAQFVARSLVKHAQNNLNANTTNNESSQPLLQAWHAKHSQLLDTFYALGADAVLVHADQVACSLDFLGLSKPDSAKQEQNIAQNSGSTLLTRLVQPLVRYDAQTLALWQELQAAAHASMVEPADDALTALHNVDDCLELQSGLLSAQHALQSEAAAKTAAQEQLVVSQNENIRLVEQHRQALTESQQEAELLLAQLHQVQEELEKQLVRHDEELKKVKADLQAQREAESQARQFDVNTSAKAQASAQQQLDALVQETNRQAQQHRQQVQELTEEGDLMMAQLHQVQEELEHYFVQYQEQKKQLQSVIKFWRQNPPTELWVDMRRTDDGSGWYEAEADGRWSGPGTESTIEMQPLAAGQYLLELHIADAMAPELVADMQLVAQLDDGQVLPVSLVHEFGAAEGMYPMASAGILELPASVQGGWQLKLVLPHVVSPAEQGGDDTRELGLRLQGVRLSLQQVEVIEQPLTQV